MPYFGSLFRAAVGCWTICLLAPSPLLAGKPIPRQKYDSVSTANRSLVEACIKAREGAARRRIEHSGYGKQICKKRWLTKDLYRGFYYRYRLSIADDHQGKPHIRIGMNLRLNIYADHKKTEKIKTILSKVRACTPHIRSVWRRYRMDFRLKIDSSFQPIPGFRPDHTVLVLDKTCRSSTSRLCFRGYYPKKEPHRQKEMCLTLLHEIGHYTGLPDDYQEAKCPDRPHRRITRGLPWSVMGHLLEDWGKIEFYPYHIRKVISPLCRRRNHDQGR